VAARLLPAATVAFAFALFCMPLACFDVWWHLEHGRWIAQTGQVPRVDLFTYGSFGAPYLDQHWGFQVLCWAVYALGGIPWLVLASAALGAATVAAGLASRSAATPVSLAAFAWILPIHVLSVRNFVRPELITLLSLGLVLWILHASLRRPRLLWVLPVLQVFAINCHSVAVANVGVIGAFALHRALSRWRSSGPLPGPSAKLELAVLAACSLAGLATPYGVDGFLLPILLMRKLSVDHAFWAGITEDLVSPLVYLDREYLSFFVVAFFAQIALGALSFALVWRDGRFDLYRALVFAAFTYLALTAQHNINLFAVAGGAVTMWNLADWAAARPRVRDWLLAARTEAGVAAILVLLFASVVTGAWHRATGSARAFGLGEQADLYIHGPAEFAGREGMPQRAYVASFAQAAVYGFHNGPARLTYIDGRLEHPELGTILNFRRVKELLADQDAMARGDRAMLDVIAPDARSPEDWPAILLDSSCCGPQIRGLLRNRDWRIVFADRTGAVFLSQPLAERLALPRASLAPLFGR
jgi:hypothetical protein